MSLRFASVAAVAAFTTLPAFCADWNPRLAADYLDARQKAWFAWPAANAGENGPCLSCHTGLTYLLVRPALRHALGESAPTPYETGLLEAVRHRLSKGSPQEFAPRAKEPRGSEALGVESVLAALLLASSGAGYGRLGQDGEQAFERIWSLQLSSGENKGAWNWNRFDLDPWEEPDSMFYGASLAALAVGLAPSEYQARPAIQENLESMKAYLKSHQQAQPLHNRLVLVWASAKLPGILSKTERKTIIDEAISRQQEDGGWTVASLGAWGKHPNAPASADSNAYATGMTAFVLQTAGIPRSSASLNRALNWLRSQQDSKSGFWEAQSMNKVYDPGTMPKQFMRDAATAFATLALLEGQR